MQLNPSEQFPVRGRRDYAGTMLALSTTVAFIATEDPDRAQTFYQETLGLPLRSRDRFAAVFDANGTTLRVVGVKQRAPAPYTVLGWEVADICAVAKQLRTAGVQFEMIPGLEQSADGIWEAPGGDRIAWFKDPDGNVLSISQHAAQSA